MNVIAEETMRAKKTGPPMPKKPPPLSVKIDPEVYRLVRTAAAWFGEDITSYLSRIVRPVAQRDVDAIDSGSPPKKQDGRSG